MSRLDIKIKAGTKIIVEYGDGMTITHETLTDTDIDHLYDTLGRLEEIERVDAENRAADVEIRRHLDEIVRDASNRVAASVERQLIEEIGVSPVAELPESRD